MSMHSLSQMTVNAIDINNVTIKFGSHTAVEDINIKIEEGIICAIVGPNGSGKTSLLKSILGVIKPTEGDIKIFGRQQSGVPTNWLGYVPQIKSLDRSFPAQSIELVASGMKQSWTGLISKKEKMLALDALESVEAGDLAYRQLSSLSGGELQRIYLARCIARRPKIFLLDEPATGIDMVCEVTINNIITEYNRTEGATIVLVTHDWAVANSHAQYVLLLNKRQVCYGKPEEAFESDLLSEAFVHGADFLSKHTHHGAHV
ncbi:MAG: Phosphonate-transporting ATPase [Ignavibacteria bacterium]|nr:Phosphonate-transporting ATPase [Ignavibacteria bacterium]